MINEFIKQVDPDTLGIIDFTQKCVEAYEETMKALGFNIQESISQSVDNSQISYVNLPNHGDAYADLPKTY